jgi:transposase
VNSAAHVNEKMPHWYRAAVLIEQIQCSSGCGNRTIMLDVHSKKRHNCIYDQWRSMAAKSKGDPPKVKALLEEGTLNPTPEKVRDQKFQENEFFDPRDIVQVKYEMLRRVSIENASVTHATKEYGVSRPTYYQSKASFDKGGIAGLVPRKRGPRGPHKLQGEALAFVEQQLVAGEPVRARELAKLIRQKFAFNIHPRTIERAVAGKKTPR